MLIRVSEPDLVEDLCANFRRAGFAADPAGGSMAEVSRLDAPAPDQEKREVEVLSEGARSIGAPTAHSHLRLSAAETKNRNTLRRVLE